MTTCHLNMQFCLCSSVYEFDPAKTNPKARPTPACKSALVVLGQGEVGAMKNLFATSRNPSQLLICICFQAKDHMGVAPLALTVQRHLPLTRPWLKNIVYLIRIIKVTTSLLTLWHNRKIMGSEGD